MDEKRVLKIAAIGDSVTAGFHVDSNIKMLYRLWFGKKDSWFSEVITKIKEKTGVLEKNYSTPGSKIVGTTWQDRLTKLKSMSVQIDQLLGSSKFPDMVLIWAGHSALDWSTKPEKNFTKIAEQFYKDFLNELSRLCEVAAKQNRKIVILVFGFINIENLFRLRSIAQDQKNQKPHLFPYFEKGYRIFPSIRPEHKDKTLMLAKELDLQIFKSTVFCKNKYENENLKVIYSDVLSKVTTTSLAHVTNKDAWHPSHIGQKELAKAVWPIVEKQINFLL